MIKGSIDAFNYLLLFDNEIDKFISDNLEVSCLIEYHISIYRKREYENKIKIFSSLKNEKSYFIPSANKMCVLFIFDKSDLVGMIRLQYYENEGEINLVYINEKYRAKGLCKKLLNKIIELTKNKIKKYILRVAENNISALRCYESCEFKKIEKINDGRNYRMELSL